MTPGDGFWDGVGQGIGSSPWWALLGAFVVVGVLFVVAKYIYPGHKEIKMRELDIREREAQNDSERIKANTALAENMRGLRESNDTLSTTNAAMLARLNESAIHSQEMGAVVTDTHEVARSTNEIARHTDSMVADIHRHLLTDGTEKANGR